MKTSGQTQISTLVTLATVALVGMGAFRSLGSASEHAIAGDATGTRRAAPMATSSQAAIINELADLGRFARTSGQVFDVATLPEAATSALRGALETARSGDVLGTRTALQRAVSAVPKTVASQTEFWDRLDFIENLSYAAGGRGARTLNRGLVGSLRRIFDGDSAMRAHMDDVIADRGQLIDNIEDTVSAIPVPEIVRRDREAWVPVANRSDTRPLLLRALDDDAAKASKALWAALKSASAEKRAWNVVTVGGGLISSHAAGVIADANPELAQLVVEAGDRAASRTFTMGGGNPAIRYNQGNRGFIFGLDGNFEFLGANRAALRGPVNPSDLAWGKFGNGGQNWSEAAAAALRASDADLLTSTRVVDIADALPGEPGRHRVTLRRGDETVEVFADTVLLGTGIDKEVFRGIDKRGLETIAAERAKLDYSNPTVVPRILTAGEELYMNALHPEWWENYSLKNRARPDLPDIYIGAGDSIYTALTFRARGSSAPELGDLYRAQRANGIAAPAVFLGGSRVPENPQQFLIGTGSWPGLRQRYTDIYPGIVRAFDRLNRGETIGPDNIALRQDRVRSVRVTEDGLVEVTTGTGETILGNRVVFGTGLESGLGSLLSRYIDQKGYQGPVQESGLLDVVDSELRVVRPEDVGLDESGVARRVPDTNIFVIGLAAGGDIIPTKQLRGISENSAAFANWAGRTGRLVSRLTMNAVPRSPVRAAAFEVHDASFLAKGAERAASIPWDTIEPLNAIDRLALGKDPRIALKYEIAKSLDDIRFNSEQPVTIAFERGTDAAGEETLLIRSNFESPDWDKAVRNNPRLLGLLQRLAKPDRPIGVVASPYGKAANDYGLPTGRINDSTLELIGL